MNSLVSLVHNRLLRCLLSRQIPDRLWREMWGQDLAIFLFLSRDWDSVSCQCLLWTNIDQLYGDLGTQLARRCNASHWTMSLETGAEVNTTTLILTQGEILKEINIKPNRNLFDIWEHYPVNLWRCKTRGFSFTQLLCSLLYISPCSHLAYTPG